MVNLLSRKNIRRIAIIAGIILILIILYVLTNNSTFAISQPGVSSSVGSGGGASSAVI